MRLIKKPLRKKKEQETNNLRTAHEKFENVMQ